uniref:Secreted protein n=1 Tax=Strongyloides venezuelensis TaxID=75913 RepID=A0A0K0FPX5_STRVS
MMIYIKLEAIALCLIFATIAANYIPANIEINNLLQNDLTKKTTAKHAGEAIGADDLHKKTTKRHAAVAFGFNDLHDSERKTDIHKSKKPAKKNSIHKKQSKKGSVHKSQPKAHGKKGSVHKAQLNTHGKKGSAHKTQTKKQQKNHGKKGSVHKKSSIEPAHKKVEPKGKSQKTG